MSHDFSGINNLNVIKDDAAANEQALDEEQLRIFSNTQFYDLDMGQNTDIGTTVDELLMQQEKEIQFPQKSQPLEEGHGSSAPTIAPRGFDFEELQQFSLAGDIPGYPYMGVSVNETTPAALHTAHRQNWYKTRHHTAEIPLFPPQGPVHTPVPIQHIPAPPHQQVHAPAPPQVHPRALSVEPEEESANRQGAEEDKRRRNTAASARFRIKKKLKEQELERNAKQMQARIDDLETKVRQLEMENKWLKNLVVERNEARDTSSIEQLRQKVMGAEP